jgi:PAS domain S-box-containing protein
LVWTLLAVAAVLFVIELAVMCILPAFGLHGIWADAADSILLALLALGPLYFLVFRGQASSGNRGPPPAKFQLFGYYIVMSVGAAATILLLVVFGLRSALRDNAIKTAEHTAGHITDALRDLEAEALIGTGADGQRGLAIEPEAIPDLDRRMRSFLAPFNIVKIKVFDRQTRIIYSTDQKIIGELNPDNAKLRAALSGIAVSKLESKDRVWDLAEEQRFDVEVVETYAPVFGADGRILGAFEIHKDVREHLEEAHATLVRSVAILGVVLLAVFSALAALMHRASRIIQSHTQALEESRQRALGMMEEAQQARQAIHESEQRHRAITESALDAMISADARGVVLFWNASAERIFGFTRDEALGRNLMDLIVPAEYHEAKRKGLAEFARTGRGQEIGKTLELSARRKDGSEFPVEISISGYQTPRGFQAVALVRDITDRKGAEDERERLLHDMGERVNELQCMYGVAESIRERKSLEEIFQDVVAFIPAGWGHPEIARGKVRFEDQEFVSEPFEETRWKQSSDIMIGGQTRGAVEVYYLEERPEMDEGPFLTEERNLINGIARALSEAVELRQAQEALSTGNEMLVEALEREKRMSMELEATMEQFMAARKEAEAATEAKSQFLANMSHEIRTPMTAILGFADLLGEGVSSCTQCSACSHCETRVQNREHVGTIKRNGEYLVQIINDILDLSKIEAGKLEVERIRFSPKQEVAEAVSLVRVRAQAKRLSLEVEYAGPIPETIQGDPVRLRQILINLLGNAVKFTEEGRVRLVVRLLEAPTERQTPRDGPDVAVMQFDIVDSGIGMTPEQVGKLFQAFSQADASTTRKFGGTGLGLTISRRLAELLGGGITVESKPGVGSTFRVIIAAGPLEGVRMIDVAGETAPATSQGADGGRAGEESAQSASRSSGQLVARILLAEDGIDNQRLISFVLRKAGAVVTMVVNGQLAADEALAAREAGAPFDVILMDMQMPVLDGYEATRLLRKKGYSGPIIALTAHAMAGDREKCLQAGCDDYARKPIERKGLIATIRKYLPAEPPDEAPADHPAEVVASSESS